MAAAMNYLKYDAVVLGNHEFNFGMEALKKFVESLSVPVISANVVKAGLKSHISNRMWSLNVPV